MNTNFKMIDGDIMKTQNGFKITLKSDFTDKQIKIVENKHNAKYVCDVDAGSLFYTEKPHPQGSNYFVIFRKYFLGEYQGTYITDGLKYAENNFSAIIADNGEVIYSRSQHDFVTSKDGSVSIDGGNQESYLRVLFENGANPFVCVLRVYKNKLKIVNDSVKRLHSE